MGTVKYTGPVASFHCPTEATIRSLKVHFSPKQEGSGDPSPENIRAIVGWDGVVTRQCGKNCIDVSFLSDASNYTISGSYGYVYTDYLYLAPNTKYRFVWFNTNDITMGSAYLYCAGAGEYIVFNGLYRQYPDGFTTDETGKIRFGINKSSAYSTIQEALDVIFNNGKLLLQVGIEDIPYESYQGSTTDYEFGVLGKNKFNYSDAIVGKYIRAVRQGADKPIGSYIDNAPSWTCSDFITVIPKQQYTLTIPSYKSASVSGIVFYSTNEVGAEIGGVAEVNFTNTGTNNPATYTFTCQDNCHYIKFSYNNTSGNEAQLEFGSSTTTYEPYNPNHTVYGGWVDLITGEVEATHYCENLNAINQEQLSNQYNTSQTVFFRCNHTYEHAHGGDYGVVDLMCETLKSTGGNWGSGDAQDEKVNTITERYNSRIAVCMRMYNSVFGIADEDDNTVKKQKINVWLAENPIRISYKLATPITYSLAPTQLQTLLGQNNVWSNADYVEVEYDLHETQTLLQRKAFIMANQPHLVSPAAAPLQNFTTDVKAGLKECKAYFSPKQDLHGYSNPWPAGGGKNIAKTYDNSYVSSTYVSFDYSAANGTFRCYGTASASSTHSSPSATNAANNGATFTLPAGTYTLSIIDGDGANIYAQCVSSDETVLAETTSYTTFTTNESLTVFVRLKVAAAATVDKTVKIQLENGSSATSYAPYENVCPISG